MRKVVKVVLGCVVWVAWYVVLFVIIDPKYVSDPLLTLPGTFGFNPFVLLKWMFWDNVSMCLVVASMVILASCATYTYTKLFDGMWSVTKFCSEEGR